MDKVLAQSVILVVTLALAAAFSGSLSDYWYSNAPLSQSQAQLTLAADAHAIYALAGTLAQPSPFQSTLAASTPPPQPRLSWVCRNMYIAPNGIFSWRCGDAESNSTSVERSFDAGGYYYYVVMAYLPPNASEVRFSFDWYLRGEESFQTVEMFVAGVLGDQEKPGFISLEGGYSEPLYYTTWFHGGTVGGSATAYAQPGSTVIFGLETSPGFSGPTSFAAYNIDYSNTEPNATLTVRLPPYLEAKLYSGSTLLAQGSGPSATLHLAPNWPSSAILNIVYANTTVASYPVSLYSGETLSYLPDSSCFGYECSATLSFQQSISLDANGSLVQLGYADSSYTFAAPIFLIGSGTSNTWTLMLLGCQAKCYVLAAPAGQL